MRLFGTDGIRGKAGKFPLDLETIKTLGLSASRVLKRSHLKPVVIMGRDTRESGKEISAALKAGFAAAGVDVWDAGILPTPGISYLVKKYPVMAGVVISASHNPYQDNGIKFFSHQGTKLPDAVESRIEELLHKKSGAVFPAEKRKGKIKDTAGLIGQYEKFLEKALGKNISLKGLKILVDCANGATYKAGPAVLSALGAEVIPVNVSPNGRNINKNCGSLHAENLARLTLKNKADCAVAFDGDGDRVIFVDEKGVTRDGDFLLDIIAGYLKEKGKLANNTLVTTVMANLGLVKSMKKRRIEFAVAKVGDRYVYEQMVKTGAVIGGEQSGHIIFRNLMQTGDGILSALQILSIMKEKKQPLSRLCAGVRKYPQVLLNTRVEKKIPIEKLSKTKESIRMAEQALRSDGRVLVRYSGTENLLRVMIEGLDINSITDMARKISDIAKKEILESV